MSESDRDFYCCMAILVFMTAVSIIGAIIYKSLGSIKLAVSLCFIALLFLILLGACAVWDYTYKYFDKK